MLEEPWLSWLLLVGRILIAIVYLVSGIHKGIWYSKAVQEFRDAKVPLLHFFLIGTIILHLIAPLLLVTGTFVTQACLALVIFTIVATFKVHHFWDLRGVDRLIQSRIFLTNMALTGGLLVLAATGPGRFVMFN